MINDFDYWDPLKNLFEHMIKEEFLEEKIMLKNIKNPIHNCTLISLLIFLWPIQSTGSIFNNWYGAYIYYYLCLIIILSFEQKKLISRPSS